MTLYDFVKQTLAKVGKVMTDKNGEKIVAGSKYGETFVIRPKDRMIEVTHRCLSSELTIDVYGVDVNATYEAVVVKFLSVRGTLFLSFTWEDCEN